MNVRSLGLIFCMCLTWHGLIMNQWLSVKRNRRKSIYRRRWWVRPVNRLRDAKGFYSNLINELLTSDHEEFFSLFRMWPEQFQILSNLTKPHLQKKSIRTPLPPELRLAVTLMFLSQGSTTSLSHFQFRIGKSTVNKIIHETCKAIWIALNPIVLEFPSKEKWREIGSYFMRHWQFPNCLGAIDGRHMRIQAPPFSGSQYYNYKQFFSMVLLATCDANYKFTWVDIGQYGSISDGGVWANTTFASDLADGNNNFPDPTPLLERDLPFPYVFVRDEAFPLSKQMMRPYPRKQLTDASRVFNYRLSRARRTIENTFGILTTRWRILHKPLVMSPANCVGVFQALVCLHNFIMLAEEGKATNERIYAPHSLVDQEDNNGSVTEGQWRRHFSPHFSALGRIGGNRSNTCAYGLRNYLRDYFISETGEEQAPWQDEYTFRGANINPPQ